MERQLGQLGNRREETDGGVRTVGTGSGTWGGGGFYSESAKMPSEGRRGADRHSRHILAPSGQGPLSWPAPASRLSHRVWLFGM